MQEPRVRGTAKEIEIAQASFGRCLVDGDSDASARARRSRRKALSVSIVIETGLLALVVLSPLMTTVAQPHLTRTVYIPFSAGAPHGTNPNPRPAPVDSHSWKHVVLGFPIPNVAPRPTPPEGAGDSGYIGSDLLPGLPVSDASVLVETRPEKPSPLDEVVKKDSEKRPLKLSEPIVHAQLISRVEPRYPVLARQIRLEGVVLLHAVISREGGITALEAVSGHPLLVQAALDAVRQWRYRPTILDGEPVEVETTITVIFRLQ